MIYAQRLSNIAKLTKSDVIERDGEVFVQFGKEHVLMPEPLGTFLRDLPWRRQIGISGKLHAAEWLFPGRQAGRHQHPDYLRVRLGALGIDCRAQRRAALLQLATEVPASVLADMLKLAPSTASKWVEWAGATGATTWPLAGSPASDDGKRWCQTQWREKATTRSPRGRVCGRAQTEDPVLEPNDPQGR